MSIGLIAVLRNRYFTDLIVDYEFEVLILEGDAFNLLSEGGILLFEFVDVGFYAFFLRFQQLILFCKTLQKFGHFFVLSLALFLEKGCSVLG